jgi:hypothetical protein
MDPTHAPRDSIAWGLIALSAFTLTGFAGCAPTANPPDNTGVASARMTDAERAATRAERLAAIKSVGEGVYIFPADSNFAETLADFKHDHQELRFVSMTQGVDVTYSPSTDGRDSRSNSFVVALELDRNR